MYLHLKFTITDNEALLAHCPALGVKVYVVVVVLVICGLQIPEILLVEIEGIVNWSPEQIGLIGLKTGVILGLTSIVIWVLFAHWFAFGKKV